MTLNGRGMKFPCLPNENCLQVRRCDDYLKTTHVTRLIHSVYNKRKSIKTDWTYKNLELFLFVDKNKKVLYYVLSLSVIMMCPTTYIRLR